MTQLTHCLHMASYSLQPSTAPKQTDERPTWPPKPHRGALTLGNVILPLQAGPLSLGHLGRLLWLLLLVKPALVEHLGQVGRVHLPQLLIVIQSCSQVPVLACKTAKEASVHLCLGSSYPHHPPGAHPPSLWHPNTAALWEEVSMPATIE